MASMEKMTKNIMGLLKGVGSLLTAKKKSWLVRHSTMRHGMRNDIRYWVLVLANHLYSMPSECRS